MVDTVSCGGTHSRRKLHFVTGDISVLTMLGSMRVFVCNKALSDDSGIPNLYETVNKGEWTIDFVSQLIKDMYKDNGDSQVDEKDTFGLQMGCARRGCFIAASLVKMSVKDDNGIPYLDMPVNQMSSLIDKLYDLMYENQGTYVTSADAADTAFAMMQETGFCWRRFRWIRSE